MAEQEPSGLDSRFARYRTGLAAQVHGPGPDAVRRTVRQRRRTALATTSALAVALVVSPLVGYAANRGEGRPPSVPAGSIGPTGSPSTRPPETPPPRSTTPGTPSSVPDGRISRGQLLAARVDLPAWRPGPGCPAGRGVRLTGEPVHDGDNVLVAVDHTDLDGDGSPETVALVRCIIGQGGPAQVVAFDRDRGGRIVTVGQVFRTERWSGPADVAGHDPEWLLALDARPDGSVRIEMADIAPGGGWRLEWSQRQWRTYRWNGQRFTQTGGPTTFASNPRLRNVGVHATDLTWGAARTDGTRSGTTTVTIRNHGDRPFDGIRLVMRVQPGLYAQGDGWSACTGGPPAAGSRELTCRLGPLDAGASRTLVLGLAGPTSGSGTGIASVEPLGPDGEPLLDPDRENNEGRFTYR
ncbi:hypothetical protein V6U90_02975 [Micromonospora sp. CPCC 206060]|uniref:hypothetical protein n=1 Tax=Micromonospora sp. CPCC 206060 TaxID=3122406 RepID=UPI002FF0841E